MIKKIIFIIIWVILFIVVLGKFNEQNKGKESDNNIIRMEGKEDGRCRENNSNYNGGI